MTTYRTGNNWGVTIVREGRGPEDVMGHHSGDELVAVVVNGDRDLAERICERLNERETAQVSASPATETAQQPSAGGNGWAEAQRGAEGFEIDCVYAGGTELYLTIECLNCDWIGKIEDVPIDIAEMNLRAAEHTEVCR